MAPPVDINYWAVLVAAVANMVLGFLWYGYIFGKPWARMMGYTKEKMEEMKKKGGMGKSYLLMFIGTLLMNYIFSYFIGYAQAATITAGLLLGVMVWLGFFVTTMIGSVLWEGKPVALYILNVGYHLVNLLISGAILAGWQ